MAQTEHELLLAAGGDEVAFRELVMPLRSQLHAHCYRMLGSVHDADDALQDVLLRAWRGLAAFEGRSSLRSWLYRIATNVCLSMIERRPKRVLPLDRGLPDDPDDSPGVPLVESEWLEPYPDSALEVQDDEHRLSNALSSGRASSWRSWRRSSTCRATSAPRCCFVR